MRPLSPFCGTVLNAQLLIGLVTISTSANGVVTTQLSFLPPASSSATEVLWSSDSRPASALPPEPAPTITKSKMSLTRIPLLASSVIPAPLSAVAPRNNGYFCRNLGFCARSGKSGSPGRIFEGKQQFWPSQKLQKTSFGPFQRGQALIHTPRTRWLWPGSPSQKARKRTDGPLGARCGSASGPPEKPKLR